MTNTSKAKYSSNIRNYLTGSIMTSMLTQHPSELLKNHTYKVGDIIQCDNRTYIATSSGNSGDNRPTHTNGIISFGKLSWLYMGLTSISNSVDSNLYITLGGTSAWKDDSNVPAVVTNDITLNDVKQDILTLIKLDGSNVRYGLKRINWTQNNIYDEYNPLLDLDDPLNYKNGFYVINTSYDIYKCISNGGDKPSIVEPTGQSVNQIDTKDGYIWKYMGSVEKSDISKFLTPDYVPITVKLYDDGSEQWKVQNSAKNGSIGSFTNITTSGSFSSQPKYEIHGNGTGCVPIIHLDENGKISNITTFNGGEGYNQDTYITIYEDGLTGEGAQATTTITDGALESITIVDGGTGYTVNPTVIIVGDGSGAQAEATINQTDGSINTIDITSGGTGYTYSEIVIIRGSNVGYAKSVLSPVGGHGKNMITELGANSIIFSCKNSPEMSPYILTGDDSTYRQISLVSNVSNIDGKSTELMLGSKHPKYNDKDFSRFDTESGFVLWVNNKAPITRSKDQEEYIKIVYH